MSMQFSIESIEYLAEKFNNCQSLSHESLAYLTLQTSELISNLLQDACKVLRKCRRKDLTTDDFAFALKLHHLEVNVALTEGNKIIWSNEVKTNNVLQDRQTGLMTVHIGSGEYRYQAFWE